MESEKSKIDFSKIDKVSNSSKSEDKPKKKETYKSKEGFTKANVVRGYTEIKKLLISIPEIMTDGMICGGYARYMVSPHKNPVPADDLDIYCRNEDVFSSLKEKLNSVLKKKAENDISITYDKPDSDSEVFGAPKVQLIKPVKEGAIVAVGDRKTILENFDFTVVRCALLNPNEALVDADFEHDEKNRFLRIKNIHCPISSLLRCIKYIKKGYWAPPSQLVKLFVDWESRPDEYRTRILELFRTSQLGNISEDEINELEALLRID